MGKRIAINIPYVPLYDRLARPLNAARLRASVRERKIAVGLAETAWQATKAAFHLEVQRAVYRSQDNPLARVITSSTGEGSKCLPRQVYVPEMPRRVVRSGAIGLVGAACVFGATQLLPWLGLATLGLVCEVSAAVGLGLRYGMAGLAAVGGALVGAWRGARMGTHWYRTTTLNAASTPTQEKLAPAFAAAFAGSAWPPAWEILHGVEVSPQFVRDVARGDTLACSFSREDDAVTLSEGLTMLSPGTAADTSETRQEAAMRRLNALCNGGQAWVSHVTCVLNQSLGNVPAAALWEYLPLRQGGLPVAPANSPLSQRHTVLRRDQNTLVVNGKLGWQKGCRVSDAKGQVLAEGTSTALWFTYRLTVERPQNAADPLRTELEEVAWTLDKDPVTMALPRSPRPSLQALKRFSTSLVSLATSAD